MTVRPFPRRPVLQPWREYAVTPDRVIMRYAEGAIVFEGRASITLLPEMLSRLDGSRTVAELLETLGGPDIEPAVTQALEQLHSRGLLQESDLDDGVDDDLLRTARSLSEVGPGALGVDDIVAAIRLARVVLIGDGPLADSLGGILRRCGVGNLDRLAESAGVAGLAAAIAEAPEAHVVVVPRSPYARVLTEVNRWALAERRDWMQVLPYDGHRAVLGPVFAPGQTGCYHCFRLRRRSTIDFHQESVDMDAAADRDVVRRSGEWRSPAQDSVIAGQAAYYVLWNVLPDTRSLCPLLGRAVAVEWTMIGPAVTDHLLLRVPRCRECGRARDSGVPQPWFTVSAATDGSAQTAGADIR